MTRTVGPVYFSPALVLHDKWCGTHRPSSPTEIPSPLDFTTPGILKYDTHSRRNDIVSRTTPFRMIPSRFAPVTLRAADAASLGVSIVMMTTVNISRSSCRHIISWAVVRRGRNNSCPWVFEGWWSVIFERTVARCSGHTPRRVVDDDRILRVPSSGHTFVIRICIRNVIMRGAWVFRPIGVAAQ